MELLNLLVRIGVNDEASGEVDRVSSGIIGKLAGAAKTAAKALAGLWAVKKVVDFGKAAFSAYAQFEQLAGGVAKLYGNAGMSIEDYAKSVGKSVGEVEKDYKRNERAEAALMKHAQESWKTAGTSANRYMEVATGFSAALINSLEGDTEKAAERTDVAMRAISDNVNTFGTDMTSVTNAFQGFAKQNYTMLDNLKLGYGGTKAEMERLIDDANKWAKENGKAADLSIDKFSDVVTAIDYIQQKQGIAGTTMREAMTTIEGSMNAAKAAWTNLISEFGKPDADLGARVADLVDSIFGMVDEETGKREGGVLMNVTKEVQTIAQNVATGVSTAFTQGIDWLYTSGPDALASALENVINSMSQTLDSLLSGESSFDLTTFLFGNGEDDDGLVGKVGSIIERMGTVVTTYGPQIADLGIKIATTIGDGLVKGGQEFVSTALETVIGGLPPQVQEKIDIIAEKFTPLWEKGQDAWEKLSPELENIKTGITDMADKGVSKLQELADGFINMDAEDFSQLIDDISAKFEEWLPFLTGVTAGIVAFNVGMAVTAGFTAIQGIISGITGAFAAFNAVLLANPIVAVVTGLAMLAAMLVTAYHTNDEFRQHVDDAWNKAKGIVETAGTAIGGFIEGVTTAFQSLKDKAIEVWDSITGFFDNVAKFMEDPIGSIQAGLGDLVGAYDATATGAEDSMARVEGSIDKAMTNSGRAVDKYNNKPLKDKKATAKVDGNAVDGTAKSKIDDTDKSVKNLSGKSVDVTVNQRGLTATAIDTIKSAIDRLKDKSITVTTNNVTKGKSGGGAWGGIRPHATGGIKIANRFGAGVPLDVVGERGPEAIVPLTSRYGKDFARMMGAEAGKYLAGLSSGGNQYNLYYSGEQSALDMFDDLTFRMQVLEAMGD